jgi:hypothetical protein
LRAEDEAKLGFYRQELESTSQPGQRIEVHWQEIRWLLLKYQIAGGGLGLEIAPEWESQLPETLAALSEAYANLGLDYADLVAALPQSSLVDPGAYQAQRIAILSGRLGHNPGYPADRLAGDLRRAAADAIASGMQEKLYVGFQYSDSGIDFHFVPAAEYARDN